MTEGVRVSFELKKLIVRNRKEGSANQELEWRQL